MDTLRTHQTHEVLNQATPLEGTNFFDADLALQEALEREGGGWALDRARDTGAVAGGAEAQEHGRRAERNEPRLRSHDRYGRRVDEIELDPSWHWLLRGAVEREIHALPWRDPRPGAHAARATLELLWTHANAGVMCPVSMTYSAIPALRRDPALAAEWEPRLTLPDYERGALCGMAMTEKQGGSDVRANTTRAEPAGDGWWELTGHKWFCSYPPCAVFLVLAQAPAGLSCFVLERGPGMEFQRLKDKLGTRSLPSSEVEFRAAAARLLGEEGRGVATIIEMVTHTRLDCVIGSAAGMRRGPVVPRPRKRPAVICGSTELTLSQRSWRRPPAISVITCCIPLYGTCTICVPVMSMKSSMLRCIVPPLPAEPNISWPGLRFA